MTDRNGSQKVTDNVREAGSTVEQGPAREQVVIRDKRKIDAAGRAKEAAGAASPAEVVASGGADAAADASGPAAAGTPAPSGAEVAGADGAGTGTVVEGVAVGEKPGGGPIGGGTGVTEPSAAPTEAAGAAAEGDGVALAGGFAAELESMRKELDERLGDLQRLTAEYANYRKRVERDRAAMVEQAIGVVVSAMLPILDAFDQAKEHGELVGAFATVSEQVIAALGRFGLVAFGTAGDAFDPTRHEAVTHETSTEVDKPTCISVLRRGYQLGERLLRPALVAVADPA